MTIKQYIEQEQPQTEYDLSKRLQQRFRNMTNSGEI